MCRKPSKSQINFVNKINLLTNFTKKIKNKKLRQNWHFQCGSKCLEIFFSNDMVELGGVEPPSEITLPSVLHV